jgi:hypothetical protein
MTDLSDLSVTGAILVLDDDILRKLAARIGINLAEATPVTWPATGPATELIPAEDHGADRVRFRKPTLVKLTTGGRIDARGHVQVRFAFTEDDGTLVTYHGDVAQDTLFSLLYLTGHLHREVQPASPPPDSPAG